MTAESYNSYLVAVHIFLKLIKVPRNVTFSGLRFKSNRWHYEHINEVVTYIKVHEPPHCQKEEGLFTVSGYVYDCIVLHSLVTTSPSVSCLRNFKQFC
jgi:hypothetical protein